MQTSHKEIVSTETRPLTPRSIDGWALTRLLSLEGPEHILQFAISASDLRRQCIYLALSVLGALALEELAQQFRRHCPSEDWRGDAANDLSLALTKWRARDIVEAVFGTVAPGMVGALSKIGSSPFREPATYRKLHELLSGDHGLPRAEALLQTRRISEQMVHVASVLDLVICCPGVLQTIRTADTALTINKVIELARSLSNATDDGLRQSVPPDEKGGWKAWANRWVGRAEHYAVRPPVSDDHEIVGLHTPEQMRDAGRRFANCLQSKIPGPALGRCYYLEWKPVPAIIVLESLSGGHWLLGSIWGVNNSVVGNDVRAAIWTKLKQFGVLIRATDAHGHEWNDVAKLLCFWDFDETLEVELFNASELLTEAA
jgi:hypothetical protein